ncbi:hypothetical protein Q7A53_15795 [Halobacillus rhizosphaerae]
MIRVDDAFTEMGPFQKKNGRCNARDCTNGYTRQNGCKITFKYGSLFV